MQPPQNLLVTITYTLLWKLSAIAQPACETFPTRETCTCHSRSNLDGSKSLPRKDLYRQSLLSSRRIASAQSCHLFTSKCLLWDLKCSNAPKWYNDLVGYDLPNKKTQDICFPKECLSTIESLLCDGVWLVPIPSDDCAFSTLFPANAQSLPKKREQFGKEIKKRILLWNLASPQMGK